MNQKTLTLALPDGSADAALYTSNSGAPQPGVLLLPDVGGPREVITELASRIVAQGYVVLVPNPFFRTSKPPVFSFPRKPGDPATRQRMQELLRPLTPEAKDADCAAYIDFLTAQPSVRPGGIGVVGFCVGGLMAFRAAAVRPAEVRLAASFHGGGLYKKDDAKSAHRNLPKITARLYFGHAVEDGSMNAEAIAELEQALKQWGGQYESEVYADAHHGWTLRDNHSYLQPQAARAEAKLMSLLKKVLP